MVFLEKSQLCLQKTDRAFDVQEDVNENVREGVPGRAGWGGVAFDQTVPGAEHSEVLGGHFGYRF